MVTMFEFIDIKLNLKKAIKQLLNVLATELFCHSLSLSRFVGKHDKQRYAWIKWTAFKTPGNKNHMF